AALAQARAAAGPMGLVARSDDRVWLCTLGPAGGSSQGGSKVAEIGPLPPIAAPRYLLRVVEAGKGAASPVASAPMQVSSSGPVGLHALVMFVVDATRPFSSPAKLP